MKKLIITTLLCICHILALAQKKAPLPGLRYGANQFYSIAPGNSKIELLMTIDKFTKWIQCRNDMANQPFTNYAFLEGTHKTKIIAFIPQLDIQNYRFSIIENDTTWLATNARPIAKFPAKDGRVEIELGNFDILDKKLTIEMYSLSERNKVSTAVIYNSTIEPLKILAASMAISDLKNVEFATTELTNNFRFQIHSRDDKFSSIRLTIKPNDLSFMYHVYLKNTTTGKIVFTANDWHYDFYAKYAHLEIDASYFTEPGDYQLIIKPGISPEFERFLSKYFPEKTKLINFTVLPIENIFEESFIAALIAFLLIIVFITGLVIYFIKRRAQKKILQAQRLKDVAQLELSSVRSQLNPHFMFNALSGIQNLMNKNEVDQANRYLAKFARITRRVLDNKDLTSLTDEKALLDDYLQMEQLRFGFNYEIVIDKSLNADNVEIPVMLLQPFIENAVKHGIADMGKNGYIYVGINSEDQNIVLCVKDNGKGFNTGMPNEGLGIKLIEKKIALLNHIFTASQLTLHIKSAHGSTTVLLTLNQWL